MSRSAWTLATAGAFALAACTRPPQGTTPGGAAPTGPAPALAVIPAPASMQLSSSEYFVVDSATTVVLDAGASDEVARVGEFLESLVNLHPARAQPRTPGVTGPRLVRLRRLGAGETAGANTLRLTLAPDREALGAEGYELTVARDQVTIVAREARGLFYGVQTVRQLLPWSVEHPGAIGRDLRIPTGKVIDSPRYAWRGFMLDVARHFLAAEDVKRFIDNAALYKFNRLHLHLTDDQGWRIEVKSWPNLTRIGGLTEVGGGEGGYYTQEQFADLVAYARSRYMEVIPEIEMPAHINAALSSYPELNCDNSKPPGYTGIAVGFSALCVTRDTVFRFVDDVVREVGGLVPTPWFHVGGDEVEKLTHEQYARFVERVEQIVIKNGKRMVGWGEIATANIQPSSIVQHWIPDSSHVHAARGGQVILSPATRIYVDMKYDSSTVLGLDWAALIEVRTAYDWEPATLYSKLPERAILGVEAPLWAETVEKRSDYEYLAFPRLLAVSELGWSPPSARDWEGFRRRLGAQGPRLQALGINFYRSPQVPWVMK